MNKIEVINADGAYVVSDGGRIARTLGLGDDTPWHLVAPTADHIPSRVQQMEALLASRGRLKAQQDHKGALIILTAEKSLIQAGMDTDGFDTDGQGFQSNILRNTKQVALMIAEAADKLSFEALLVATEPKTAQSLGSVIRGLIALVAFDEDMDPGMAEVIQTARVDVDDVALKLSIAMSPESFTAALD